MAKKPAKKPVKRKAKKAPPRKSVHPMPDSSDVRMTVAQLLAQAKNVGAKLNEMGLKPQQPFADIQKDLDAAKEAELDALCVPATASRFVMTDYQKYRLRELAAERAKRRSETLKLYEPLPPQLALHQSRAHQKLAIGSNRGTKTTACAVEVAMAVTGTHPWLSGVPGGYPLKDGRLAIIGYDEAHLGGTIFAKLFLSGPGSMKICRDKTTGLWRPYRPWTEEDKNRPDPGKGSPDSWRYAPPLIPPRFIKGKISWRRMGMSIPEKITLINGWEINFYSSKAKPVQGVIFHLVWFDEEIKRQQPSWYHEMSARLTDVDGYLLWSATPHLAGDDLIELHDEAELQKESGTPNPDTEEFFFSVADNPHLSETGKQRLYDKYKHNPAELRTRFYGEYARLGTLIYPEFSKKVHACPESILPFDSRDPPLDWARYIALDPGRQVCAALFCAVPPPEFLRRHKLKKFVVLYDEMYLRMADAQKFGSAIEYRTRGQDFELMLIDMMGGRVHGSGDGIELQQHYSRALRSNDVWSRFRRRSFVTADCDRKEGIESFREWLIPGGDGCPYVYILPERMPNFLHEVSHWSYKKVEGRQKPEPEERNRHLMDCARYLAMYSPSYRLPAAAARPKTAVQIYMEEKQARNKQDNNEGVVFGPNTHHSRYSYN